MADFDPRASSVRMVAASLRKGQIPTDDLINAMRELNCALAASLRNIANPKKNA